MTSHDATTPVPSNTVINSILTKYNGRSAEEATLLAVKEPSRNCLSKFLIMSDEQKQDFIKRVDTKTSKKDFVVLLSSIKLFCKTDPFEHYTKRDAQKAMGLNNWNDIAAIQSEDELLDRLCKMKALGYEKSVSFQKLWENPTEDFVRRNGTEPVIKTD